MARTLPLRVSIVSLPTPAPGKAILPYLWGTLRAYAEQSEEIRNQVVFGPPVWRMAPLAELLDEIGTPDICAFSIYLWNARNSLRLARAVKERQPSCRIVFGGPHVPNGSTAFLDAHPEVDMCVHGEGEEAFAGILRESLRDRPDWSTLAGISYREAGTTHLTASHRMTTLDFPSPYLNGFLDDSVAEAQARGLKPVAFLETNRGCPYSCSFCDWGMATMSKIRQFPEARVKGELEWMSRLRIHQVVLCDANFGIFPRDLDFVRHIVHLNETTGFPRRVKVTGFAKNNKDRLFETTRLFGEHGLLGDDPRQAVNFSIQTMSQSTLAAIDRSNIPLEGYRKISDLYRENDFTITPDLILPLAGETAASFKEGYATLASMDHVGYITVYPCIILPNAPMARPSYRERWGLVTRTERVRDKRHGLRADVEEEDEEFVVATNTMSEDDVADCKVFLAAVEAFELCGLLKPLRKYVERTQHIPAAGFYDGFLQWQLSRQASLARVLTALRTEALAHPTMAVSNGHATDYHPQLSIFRRVRSSKAVLYDALSQPQRFTEELRGFLRENHGWSFTDAQEEVLRFQVDTWITPSHDPRQPVRREFSHDWRSFLDGSDEAPARRSTTVEHAVHHDWLAAGYTRPSIVHWLKFALSPGTSRAAHCSWERRALWE